MKKTTLVLLFYFSLFLTCAQTDLTEAVDFQVKAVSGETIKLFPILDEQSKIVVIDFFSTSCGPCQEYALDFQNAYEILDSNNGNVYFMGINTNSNNEEVIEFDSVFGLTYPSVSGLQGGGDNVYEAYHIMAYPTVIVITPDHQIVEQFIWPPDEENIISAVIDHGGIVVGNKELKKSDFYLKIFPNPANDKAYLSLALDKGTYIEYEINDQFGSLIYLSGKQFFKQGVNQTELPVELLKAGIYFVKINGTDYTIETIKLVISK